MPCNVECLKTYDCGVGGRNGVIRPLDGSVFAPYVKIGFGGENAEITVGNISSKPDNTAVISSFEYGSSEGQGMSVEIIDEKGTEFSHFMERLSKTLSRAGDEYKLFAEFGWIITDCNGNTKVIKTTDYGGYLHFLPLKIQTIYDYQSSKIKFKVSGQDFESRIRENRVEKNQGDERHKKTLKQAIRDVFAKNNPPVTSVRFLKSDESDEEWCFKESDGGCEGPKSVWPADQQNVLATVRKWITPLSTENDKGITIEWNAESEEPEIILYEGGAPAPNENEDDCKTNLGTYIVNGGDCSPVISFTPNVNWGISNTSGGQSSGATSGSSTKQTGEEGSKKEKGGIQQSSTAEWHSNLWREQDKIVDKTQKAQAAHDKAVYLRENPQPISAELKIQGDPFLVFPRRLVGKKISIIVINPSHVKKKKGSDCGDWLAEPVCNNMFSNKKWEIMGVNHQINLGQYITTLNVTLHTPNSSIEPDQPLGGENSGGPTFENAMPTE